MIYVVNIYAMDEQGNHVFVSTTEYTDFKAATMALDQAREYGRIATLHEFRSAPTIDLAGIVFSVILAVVLGALIGTLCHEIHAAQALRLWFHAASRS